MGKEIKWSAFDPTNFELPFIGAVVAGDWSRAKKLVPLRRATKILGLQVMSLDYLKQLLSQVWLRGNPKAFIYKDCEIAIVQVDPNQLLVGQTYIEMPRYQMLTEGFQNFFSGLAATSGMANHAAFIVLCGVDDGSIAIAYHIPPLIEEHAGRLFLIDGVHRHLTAKLAGVTIASVIIKDVEFPFPCDVHGWKNVHIVIERPSHEERFLNAKPELFRQLKEVGIGG